MTEHALAPPASKAYWGVTALFALALGFSGIAHTLRLPPIQEGMQALGYPMYVTTILGPAKLLGVAAILAPRRPLLKEWAYAGFAFNLFAATTSHIFARDSLMHILPPAVLLALGAVSYHLRPASRRLALEAAVGPDAVA